MKNVQIVGKRGGGLERDFDFYKNAFLDISKSNVKNVVILNFGNDFFPSLKLKNCQVERIINNQKIVPISIGRHARLLKACIRSCIASKTIESIHILSVFPRLLSKCTDECKKCITYDLDQVLKISDSLKNTFSTEKKVVIHDIQKIYDQGTKKESILAFYEQLVCQDRVHLNFSGKNVVANYLTTVLGQ